MRYVRFYLPGKNKTSYGILSLGSIERLDGETPDKFKETGEIFHIEDIDRFMAPVFPPNIIAIGLNYKDHAREFNLEIPKAPVIFLKSTNTIIGPEDPIILPKIASDEVDYEAELVVVIGRKAKNISEKEVSDYIWGYTCGNDVSARDCQTKLDQQWARGKSFDSFCPIGPWIESEFNHFNAGISLRLNGEIMQSSNTSDLIFSIPEIVSYVSKCMTLVAGTIIMTGTPGGVGFKRNPPVYLKSGNNVEVEIEGIGKLINFVKNEE